MNHISQGLISPLPSQDSKVKAYEALSWFLLLSYNLEQDELPEFRMKDNLFSL